MDVTSLAAIRADLPALTAVAVRPPSDPRDPLAWELSNAARTLARYCAALLRHEAEQADVIVEQTDEIAVLEAEVEGAS